MATKEELYEAGLNLFSEDKLDEAIRTLEQALAVDPNYVDALHALSMTYSQKGLLDEAISECKKLVAIEPDNVLAHTSLSMFYQQKGMIEEAERESALAKTMGWKAELKKAKPQA